MTIEEAPRIRYRNLVWNSDRWNGFAFRDDDIVISTQPKCGTTWMQMQCALLLFRTPDLPLPLARLFHYADQQADLAAHTSDAELIGWLRGGWRR